jgi:hypothetical protein
MTTLKKDKEQYILVEKEQYLNLIRDVTVLKQKAAICEEALTRLEDLSDKTIEIIEIVTEKIWGKK